MKKLFILSIIFFSLNAFAQFEKYENNDQVKSYIVNKKMFEMMSKMKVDLNDENAKLYLNLIKKLDKLVVYTTLNSKLATEFKSTANKYITDNNLEELMRVNEAGKNVKVYFKNGVKKELFMFVDDKESILLSLELDISEFL